MIHTILSRFQIYSQLRQDFPLPSLSLACSREFMVLEHWRGIQTLLVSTALEIIPSEKLPLHTYVC